MTRDPFQAPPSPLTALQRSLRDGSTTPQEIARACIANANTNASHNTYQSFDPAEILAQVASLPTRFPGEKPPLYAVPISLKDCFDLAGRITTCGSRFYAATNAPATKDSAIAARLCASACLIPGKTHLHPLAYGITGQNPDFDDCLQPRDPTLLTGGSSSGAAASVQEGSALAAIGTDTGGSIRVPAALCGLAGFRCSQDLPAATGPWPQAWTGAAHLAPSFDTLGLLCRDPRDLQPLAETLFGIPHATPPPTSRIACIPPSFLYDAEPAVLEASSLWKQHLAETGTDLSEFDPAFWHDTTEIFAGLQAHEAAAIHHGHFHEFEPPIAQRLAWGESLTTADIQALRARMSTFRERMATLFTRFDLLMLPSAPVSRLRADADHSATRQIILRYTTPFSLAGLPAVALPGELLGGPFGTGIQLAAAPGNDSALLAFVSNLHIPVRMLPCF